MVVYIGLACENICEGTVLIKLIDVESPSPRWVAPSPKEEVLNWRDVYTGHD